MPIAGQRFGSAGWDYFLSLCIDQLTMEHLNVPDSIKLFSDQLVHIATYTILKTLAVRCLVGPRFGDVCKQARKQR